MGRRERGFPRRMLEPVGQGKQMPVDRARVTMCITTHRETEASSVHEEDVVYSHTME